MTCWVNLQQWVMKIQWLRVLPKFELFVNDITECFEKQFLFIVIDCVCKSKENWFEQWLNDIYWSINLNYNARNTLQGVCDLNLDGKYGKPRGASVFHCVPKAVWNSSTVADHILFCLITFLFSQYMGSLQSPIKS